MIVTKLEKSLTTLIFGDYYEYEKANPYVYMYTRTYGNEAFIVICSFAGESIPFILPKVFRGVRTRLMVTNYADKRNKGEILTLPHSGLILYPYEALVLRAKTNTRKV